MQQHTYAAANIAFRAGFGKCVSVSVRVCLMCNLIQSLNAGMSQAPCLNGGLHEMYENARGWCLRVQFCISSITEKPSEKV